MNDFLKALSLLTTWPCRPNWDDGRPAGQALVWYPVVGLLVAVPLALVWAAAPHEGSAGLLTAALVLVAWAVVTGGLHLDGWADCCDGLLATAAPERRLEYMRDPRLGSFGGLGLLLLLLVKLAAIQALPDSRALWLAPVLARWLAVLAAWHWPPARPGGLGAAMTAGLRRAHLGWATAAALVLALAAGSLALPAVALALAAGWGFGELSRRRIGGVTGDVLGGTIELVETVVLVGAALLGSGQ